MHWLLTLFRSVAEFVFIFIGLKLIVAHWIADQFLRWLTGKSDRAKAIRDHHFARIAGQGHKSKAVADCMDTGCSLFKTS